MELFVLALVWLVPSAAALQDAPCKPCGGTGRVACEKHRPSDVALEANALVCTFYAGCTPCGGRGTVDCAACAVVEDEAAVARRTALAKRFPEYEAALGRPLLGAASAHFDLVCEIGPMKAEKKRRTPHELLHLHLARLEAVQAAYLELFGLTDKDITARSEVFLWTTLEDHKKAGQAFCFYTPDDPAYRRGLESRSSIWVDPKKMEEDADVHRNVVHHVVHGLMNAQEPIGYTGKLRMGWIDEGLSMWFEDRLLGSVTGFCFWPPEEPARLRGGKWRPALAKVLEAQEPLDFEALLQMDTVDMTREQHALGFALVDYLMEVDPLLVDKLLRTLRARTPARDAFHEVYGLALDELERRWRAWMEKTYPRR